MKKKLGWLSAVVLGPILTAAVAAFVIWLFAHQGLSPMWGLVVYVVSFIGLVLIEYFFLIPLHYGIGVEWWRRGPQEK